MTDLKTSKFYKNNPHLPRGNIKREWTDVQQAEFLKCANDPVYFARTYFKIVHLDHGLVPLDLYEFQEEMIIKCQNNRNVVSVQSRQSGKSTTATVVLLHEVIFSEHKTVAILANKAATSKEILKRIKTAFEHLPDFLKPGVVEWNKSAVELDNGCVIMAEASSSDNIRGRSINILFLDELAFIPGWDEFAASVLPTISSGSSTKLIATSTPNGLNHFYHMVEGARKGKNDFALVEVPWYRVPGRDEEWKQNTLKMLNFDAQKFDQEYNCQFLGSSGTLINGATLKLMEHSKPIYQSDKGLYVYENAIPGHIYAMIVDSSQGKGLDYSALSVIDITEFPYRQVAVFRSNTIGHYDYSTTIFTLAKQYNNPQILIELNCPTGAIVAEDLFWRHEYENILMTQGAGRLGKKISSGYGGGNIDRGVYTTASVKSTCCAMLKILIEQNQLILHDQNTILELTTFSKKGNSYEAEEGNHDDLVMGLVLFGWLSIQEYFKEMTDSEIQEKLREETDDDIDEFVGGAMLVNNGLNEHHEVEYY